MLNCRDLAAVGGEDRLQGVRVVERRDNGLGDPACRDAGACGNGPRRSPVTHGVTRRLDAHQDVIVVPVVATLHLHDLLAARVTAGHADGVHGRLGPRVAEPDQVAAEAALDLLGQEHAVLNRERVAGAVVRPVAQRLGHRRVGVAGAEHAEGHVEVDVLVPVHVPDTRPASVGHEQRVRVVRLERAGDAERE